MTLQPIARTRTTTTSNPTSTSTGTPTSFGVMIVIASGYIQYVVDFCIGSVVPRLSIGPIGQLALFFPAVRQYLPVDQLACHW
jgi:hypothetical protein